MQFKIKLARRNSYPLKGFFIKGNLVKDWLIELQILGFVLEKISVYPIPNKTANSIWGCFVLVNKVLGAKDVGKNELAQSVFTNFFIPEKTALNTVITGNDRSILFSPNISGIHIYHPTVGFSFLQESLNYDNIIEQPLENYRHIFKPVKGNFIPSKIKSYLVKATAPEEVIKNLEQKAFPKKEPLPNDKLNLFEKIKLNLYKLFFNETKKRTGENETKPTSFLKFTERIHQLLSPQKSDDWVRKMKTDFENLRNRNKKELEKLLDILRTNPEEGLKYAIPLNNSVAGDNTTGNFNLTMIWSSFSLFTGNRNYNGNSITNNDYFASLSLQYEETAQNLIKEKKYEKAAFVYLKLLQDRYRAANTLMKGGLYQEAAALFLKIDKAKAAQCYEKAKMLEKVIELYKGLAMYEKVGDLYQHLNQPNLASEFYNKMAVLHIERNRYISAAKVYRDKLHEISNAQETLLQGWESDKNTYDCLKEYFQNIDDDVQILEAFKHLYENRVSKRNCVSFIKVLQNTYQKNEVIAIQLRQLAYKIIAKETQRDHNFIEHIRAFNLEDRVVVKDIMRFKHNN